MIHRSIVRCVCVIGFLLSRVQTPRIEKKIKTKISDTRQLTTNGADKPTRIGVETIKSTDKILLNFPSNMRDEALLMSAP